jgi:ribose transport system permease protein
MVPGAAPRAPPGTCLVTGLDSASIETAARSNIWRERGREFLSEYGFLVFFAAWVGFLALATPLFLTGENIVLVLRQASIFGIPAIGATFVLIAGELDISFGALLGLSGVAGAGALVAGFPPAIGILAALAVGLVVGIANGLLVTITKIPSVVATLGMLTILEGVGLVVTKGSSIFGPQLDPLIYLAQGYVGPVPIPVLLSIIAYAIAWVVLTRTPFGMHVYLIGDNAEAAYRTGINVDRLRLIVFALAGALTAVGALILVGRVGQSDATLGADALFPVLTAVILGGTGLQGGRGRIQNTLLASLFLASIVNGLILLGVDPSAQSVVEGAILILAVSLDRLRR